MIYLLAVFVITSVFANTNIPLDFNREEYQKLIKEGSFEKKHFFSSEPVSSLPTEVCQELNGLYEGQLFDENEIKNETEIQLILNCKKIELDSKFVFSFKRDTLRTNIVNVFRFKKNAYSFITKKYLIKVFVWNGFRERSGIYQIMVYDKELKKIFINRLPLKLKLLSVK